MARPKKQFTDAQWDSVRYMCIIHCTGEEIAGVMSVDYDTLNRMIKDKYKKSFTDYYKEVSANGKMSLRRMQWKSAEAGNVVMQMFLGKQWLGQTDKTENINMDTISFVSDVPPAEDE